MLSRQARYTTIACVLLSYAPAGAFAFDTPPQHLASLSDVRAWIDENKGFGIPQSVEFAFIGRHVFVSWNSPFSGPASTYAYAYREVPAEHRWELLDFSFFPQPEFLSYAYFDPRAGKLIYVSQSGKILKSIAIVASWNEKPPS